MVIIEFILALVFVCLMISLFVSWIIEYWASQINKKGKLLQDMLGRLLDQSENKEWLTKLYEHPMVKSLSSKDKQWFSKKGTRLTSYIPPKVFSDVLASLIIEEGQKKAQNKEYDKADFNKKIKLSCNHLPEGDFKRTIQIFQNNSADNSKDFLAEIETWYNEYMLRVNHAYKRFVKLPLWIVGFVVALVFNIDSVRITTELWNDAPLRNNIAGMAEQFADTNDNPDSLNLTEQFFKNYQAEMELPIGWKFYKEDFENVQASIKRLCDNEEKPFDKAVSSGCIVWIAFIVIKLIGFILTGLIASFGAPFWYDALQKIIGLKKSIAVKANGKTT